MANSIRKQIRDAVKTALIDSGIFSTRVYIGRRDSLPSNALPAACVFIGNEEFKPATLGPNRDFSNEISVSVEAYGKATDGEAAEEELDTLRDGVLAAVCADDSLGGVVTDIAPASVEQSVDGEGAVNIGAIVITFDTLNFYAP